MQEEVTVMESMTIIRIDTPSEFVTLMASVQAKPMLGIRGFG